MAILASGHKLVRCGIDGAISGVVTDETLSGNGTSGEPLGALLENVIFDDSITESSTDFGTLIGVNPLWVNYVVTGGGSSGGDPQVNYIVNTYSGAWNNTTSVVQSNSAQWAEGGSGDVEVNSFVYDNSATINEVNTTFQNNSGNYLTAHQSLEGYATQDWVTAQGYITGVDLSNYYTKNDTSSKSEINEALTSITPGDVDVNSYVQSNSANINEVNSIVNSNSSKWNEVTGINKTYYQGLDETVVTKINGYNLQAKVDQYGNVINTTYATKSQVNDLSGKVDEISAAAGGNVEVNTYVQSNSSTINNVNTTYQTNSGKYLTAHQDISNKLDTNSFTAWSAAQAANAFKLSAGNGINLIDDSINKITRIDVTASEGDIGVNTYVRNNSAGINNAVSTYQSNSSTYLDFTTFTNWSASQEANDYELSAGNGVTLYDDTVNKITRIDVTAAGGDEEVNTLVHSNSSTWNDVTNKLDKSESANYYPRTGNPSKFIPQSALNLKIDKISGIGGSAFSVGNHNAVTFPLSDGFGGIDIGIPNDNGYLQYLCTDHISEVTLTTMPKVGNYKISANSAEYIIPGNSWITFYEQRNSKGQYRWTIKDYNGSGALTSATSTTTGGGYNFKTVYSRNENQNSAVLGYYFLADHANEIEGIVQFVPDTSGTYSVCPFTAENNDAYYTALSYQCTNSPTVNAGDVVTLPFHFYAVGQYVCPSVVGIKGSNSTATITPYNIIINYK